MRKTILLLIYIIGAMAVRAQAPADTVEHEVLIETTMGNIRVALFNDTPLHRDNFLRLVREGYYDSLLFHRVVPDFVVQAGDSASRHAVEGQKLGESAEPYTVPAEIRFPAHFHRAGALAAAREGDEVNPFRASSCYQFYIVTGRIYTDEGLDRAQAYLDSTACGHVKLTPEIRETYKSDGGMPYLDGLYTVFGQVVEGFDVVYRIQWVGRDENERPFDDVKILRATVMK